MSKKITIREATLEDLEPLLALEEVCFSVDKLSRRSFRHWLQSEQSILLVAEQKNTILAYGLVWCLRGTSLARLYSLAVLPSARGNGLAEKILAALEKNAAEQGRLFMRLEVATSNALAIRLYQRCGYHVFGQYSDYYDDHDDALRMQKTIHTLKDKDVVKSVPWYQQSTEFTCGPAALMMAMSSLNAEVQADQTEELEIWREATTIFMTSGHGGCHPVGLACAAKRRGFDASVFVNSSEPLFLSGVRSEHKKEVMRLVHHQFLASAKNLGVDVKYRDISLKQIQKWLDENAAVLMLISTYRLDGRKAPHWVMVTAIDDQCLYVHDPNLDSTTQRSIDCQHVPIARQDFEKMTVFGTERLRAAVVVRG